MKQDLPWALRFAGTCSVGSIGDDGAIGPLVCNHLQAASDPGQRQEETHLNSGISCWTQSVSAGVQGARAGSQRSLPGQAAARGH